MGDFLVAGKDLKYCKITQGTNTVIFRYAKEKLTPQPILAQNTRPGFNPSNSSSGNKNLGLSSAINGFIDKIGNSKISKESNNKDARGTTISKVGNAGYKIEIDGLLIGDYYVQRNKLLQMINSGQPCSIYLSRFQTLATSGKISDINPQRRARDGFWAVILAGDGISEDYENIAGCDVKIVAQEVKFTDITRSTNKIDNYLNPLLDIIEDVASATDTAKTFLIQINSHLTQALGVISNLGSEIEDIITEISAIADTITDLLKTPSILKARYSSIMTKIKGLGNKVSKNKTNTTQSDINNQKTLQNFAKNLSNYKSSKQPNSNTENINGSNLINTDSIKENIVNGKLINFQRYCGFGLMLAIAENSLYQTNDEVDSMINDIQSTFDAISSDKSYNGITTSQAIDPNLTQDARNHDVLGILYSEMNDTLNALRNIKQTLSSQSFITKKETNIWNIISQHYTSLIESGSSINNIAQRLCFANGISSYNQIIGANVKVFLPII